MEGGKRETKNTNDGKRKANDLDGWRDRFPADNKGCGVGVVLYLSGVSFCMSEGRGRAMFAAFVTMFGSGCC